jgi:hypothetical protein
VAPTFANLVRYQVSSMGLHVMGTSDLEVQANCIRKAEDREAGAGDWTCTVYWRGPGRQALNDTYDLSVTTDGCYTATVEGESLGGPLLQTPDGRTVRNHLYAFEGCFDPT